MEQAELSRKAMVVITQMQADTVVDRVPQYVPHQIHLLKENSAMVLPSFIGNVVMVLVEPFLNQVDVIIRTLVAVADNIL